MSPFARHPQTWVLRQPTAPDARGRSRRVVVLLAALLAVVAGSAVPAQSDEAPTGRQIMEWVDDRDDGDNQTANMTMVLIDKRDNERVRELRSFGKDKGEDSMGLIFFVSPADVKNTGFLTYDYDDPDKDDDQWLYLPALKKTKRIAGGDKKGSFMGSDFSYADMSSRPLDHYEYELLEEGLVDGAPVWVVQAIPDAKERDATGYTKSALFVRKDNHMVVRAKIWVKKGNRKKYMEVKKLEQIDGIWVPTEMTMTTKKGKQTLHRTMIRLSDVKFAQELDEDMFTVRRLEKGL